MEEQEILPHEQKFGPRKLEKQLFIEWLAQPSRFRNPATQAAFAKKFDVTEQTLCEWKKEKDFIEQVAFYRKRRYAEKGSDVLESLYKRAKSKGDAKDVKFFFEYTEGFAEKKDVELSGDLAGLLKEIGNEKLINDDTGNQE